MTASVTIKNVNKPLRYVQKNNKDRLTKHKERVSVHFSDKLTCLVHAGVESSHLYGSISWTLTRKQEQPVDWTYTRMLRAIISIH